MNNIVNLEIPNLDHIPTVASSGVLVFMNISQATLRKKDKQASEQITASNNADIGVASVNKKLLGNCAELDAIQTFVGVVRRWHLSVTQPWADKGPRYLFTARYPDWMNKMTGYKQEMARLVDELELVYNWKVMQAQASLGSLFDRKDYPSIEELRSKFSLEFSSEMIADGTQQRHYSGLTEEQIKKVCTSQIEHTSKQYDLIINDVWKRVHKMCVRVATQIDYKAHEKSKKIYDSMMQDAIDMIDLLKISNINQDPEMDRITRRLLATFNGVTKEALQKDEKLRTQTKKSIDDVIKSLPSFDM